MTVTSVKEYKQRVASAMGAKWTKHGVKLSISVSTTDEAKAQLTDIRQTQKRLRQIKKEIGADIKLMRAQLQARTANVQPGFLAAARGKGAARSSVAEKKRKEKAQTDAEIRPYQNVQLLIDDLLTQMDGAKVQLERYIQEARK